MVRDQDTERLREMVAEECADYKKRLLQQPVDVLWDSCHEILFYTSVAEYFREKKDIRKHYVKRLLCERKPIYAMWKVYLKYEDLVFQTWEEIDVILERMTALAGGTKEEGIGQWILNKS